MTNRELAICLDILVGNHKDFLLTVALTEHIDYICEHCLVDTWAIYSAGEVIAVYNYPKRTWQLGERLRATLISMGLMDEQEQFSEERARVLHEDFEGQWCSGVTKPEDVGWLLPDKKK